MSINIVKSVFTVPKIIVTDVVSITRSKATFEITGDSLGFIFYVVANRYISVPSFLGVKKKNLNAVIYNDSKPVYGEGYIKDLVNYKATIEIGGLDTEFEYDIYFFIMNMNNVHNPTYEKITFRTNRIHFL